MRYRLLETLRQYGEDQMELRGETALLRDRHATYYADLIAELDLMVRGARQIEGEERMSMEWDNLRAAHLWSLAQGELDLAERLAEGSFHFSAFSMRHEHAAMLQRTVELGDECGRPSTNMLGMLCYWLDWQGNEEDARRARPARPRRRALARSSRHGELLVRVRGRHGRDRGVLAGGAGGVPPSGRGSGQHTRSRLQLVHARLPGRRIVARGSHATAGVAATAAATSPPECNPPD